MVAGAGATTLHPCVYHKNLSDEGLKCKLSLLPEIAECGWKHRDSGHSAGDKPWFNEARKKRLDSGRPSHGRPVTLKIPGWGSMSSIKRDVKKKALPRPEGEKILSRDPAHFTVRVPLDLRERFCF